MTVISANPNALLAPKLTKSNAPAGKESSEAQTAAIPSAMIELANAEGLKQLERVQTIMELMQEAAKKMTAEVSIKASKMKLEMLEKKLSVPFFEPEAIVGDDAKKIIADGEKRIKEFMGYVPADYGHSYEGEDFWYRIKSDGTVTKYHNWAARSKQEYSDVQQERNAVKFDLLSGFRETQADLAGKKMESLMVKLGPLSEREQEFLNGFAWLTNSSISITA